MKTVIGSMWKVPQKLNSRKQTYYIFPSYCCWFQCEIDVLQLGDDFKVKDFSGVSNKMFEEENWRSKLFFYFHKSLFSGLKDLIIYMEYLWTCHKEAAFLCFKWNCSVKSLVTLTWMSLKIALSSRKWSIKSPARLKTEMIGPLKMWLLNEILSVTI